MFVVQWKTCKIVPKKLFECSLLSFKIHFLLVLSLFHESVLLGTGNVDTVELFARNVGLGVGLSGVSGDGRDRVR